jgi:hypothetical protein
VRTEPAPPSQSTVLYAEDHCALRWPLIFHATFWPILLVAAIVVLIVDPDPNLSYLLAVPLAGAGYGIIAAAVNRATGIRVTHAGVSIGGVHRQHQRRGRNPDGDAQSLPPASAQRTQVFFCPWPAVRRIEVVTGRSRMRDLARSRWNGDRILALGTLWAPFMRAALVIQVDPSQATVPQFRPPDTRRYWFKPSRPDPHTVSRTWYAPTRHPAQLRAALSQRGRDWADSD